tara:strand:- start:2751 stop:4472 length:1722 start_codon:yes stop_codon:yes gene_type:complete
MNLNVHTNHPVIAPPAGDGTEKHFVSISSTDRNISKNEKSNDFYIDLPDEYENVESVRLAGSYFPIVDDQFSYSQNNVDLVFRFKRAYNPIQNPNCSLLDMLKFTFVSECILKNDYFRIRIQNGRYSRSQLAREIQNKMNKAVTDRMVEDIFGTSRLKNWGDYQYTIAFQTNAGVQTDLSPLITSDSESINVYYRSNYDTINDAINEFNTENGQNIPNINLFGLQSTVVTPLKKYDFDNYTGTKNPIDPPTLMTWNKTLIDNMQVYLDSRVANSKKITDEFDALTILSAGIEGSSGELETKKAFLASGGYDNFKVFVDDVATKFVFGNVVDEFEIVTDKELFYDKNVQNVINSAVFFKETYDDKTDTRSFMPVQDSCDRIVSQYEDSIKWGLPVYMGFNGKEITERYLYDSKAFREVPGYNLPTFYYYDKSSSNYQPFKRLANTGFSEAAIFTVTPNDQIDLKGEPYFYMDLDELNCIDELEPYVDNEYTKTNTDAGGRLNASFAKLPLSIQDDVAYGGGAPQAKTFYPPLDRLKKIRIKLRFHNGRPVNFGVQPFSIILEIKSTDKRLKVRR